MKTLRHPFLVCTLCIGLFAPAWADEQRNVRQAVSSGQYLPLAEILKIVEQHVPGRVLEVDLEADRQQGAVYEVEVLDSQNRKREIKVHAETGQLLELDDVPAAAQALIPLPTLLRQILAQYPGHIEDVELESGSNHLAVYEILLIQHNAQRLELVVDATTGQILQGAPKVENAVQSMMALPDILDLLLKTYPGIVLEAELERERHQRSNSWYYEIDIRLNDGRQMELHVDTHTASVLREKIKNEPKAP
ncbi:hypothetical protein E9531_07270 [Lampropedia puyangensis]|uniref:PepSY domain-containing protein n=1 Tax=Lampropedia puyangensis TaxID=1330072 RepID=A0A4S8F5V9_9BURK|nr:PepSY domain-containing protein [Lampropedia puyangensis]THU02477.1 hypothetical protein E9531_07270 [Lampropedia puyangensis]